MKPTIALVLMALAAAPRDADLSTAAPPVTADPTLRTSDDAPALAAALNRFGLALFTVGIFAYALKRIGAARLSVIPAAAIASSLKTQRPSS